MEEATIAVPLVAAAFCNEGDLSAGRIAELRLVVRGQDFPFLDGSAGEGDGGSAVVAGIDVRGTVNGELMLVGARAIDVVRCVSTRARSVPIKSPRHARD